MIRTSQNNSRPAFVVDWTTVHGDSRQIAWPLIPKTYERDPVKVTVGANAAKGATSLTVAALSDALGIGEILNFGVLPAVTVTVASNAAQGATSITVNALSGAIPSGTLLDFGAGAGLFALLTADAASGATSLTVEALPEAIASAKTATFAGGTKQAVLTAPAAKGATSLTVDELQFAIANASIAYIGGVQGSKLIRAGTIMVEVASGTYAGKVVPRVDRPASETAKYLLATDAVQDDPNAAMSGYGMFTGAHVFENLLPEQVSGSIDSTAKTELGSWFKFDTYADSRS